MSLDTLLLGNPLQRWLVALAIATGAVLLLRVIRQVAVSRITRLAERTETRLDDLVVAVLSATKSWFLLAAGLYAGSGMLTFPARVTQVVHGVAVFALLLQGGLWAAAAAGFAVDAYRRDRMDDDPGTATMVGALKYVVQLVIWVVVLLLVLDNAGIDVTALVTGLGIGGIAVALAVQNIFGDLLASLAIVLDRPFVIGDFIKVDDKVGTVEHIGLKTTRVRAISGEQLVFSNADLLSARVQNFGRMYERRVLFTLGVIYQTPREALRRIPTLIREAIEADDGVRFDRSHLSAYGAYSIDFESVFFVLSPDYNAFMDAQQAIFLRIHEAFEREGIEFAYPTQTLFVERASTEGSGN